MLDPVDAALVVEGTAEVGTELESDSTDELCAVLSPLIARMTERLMNGIMIGERVVDCSGSWRANLRVNKTLALYSRRPAWVKSEAEQRCYECRYKCARRMLRTVGLKSRSCLCTPRR